MHRRAFAGTGGRVVSTERTLVVWCPDWPITAAGLGPEYAVVSAGQRVVACSPLARSEGVRRGHRLREAQARCPQLLTAEHDPAREARVFEPIMAAVETLSPVVEIVRPGLLATPTRGPSRYFGGDGALVQQLRTVLAPIPLAQEVGIGLADGRFAATQAARLDLIVPSGQTVDFLADRSIGELDRPDLCNLLLRLGIRTLGQLAALPEVSMAGRFGPDGVEAHRLARGLDARPLVARCPPPDLAVTIELDEPISRADQVAFVAKASADSLVERLEAGALACTSLAVELETEYGEGHRRQWRHDVKFTAAAMVDRVRWQLDGWVGGGGGPFASGRAPTSGVVRLLLEPVEVAPDDGRQAQLWGGETDADRRAARALARVQALLGFDAVTTAVLSGGRRPGDRALVLPWGESLPVDIAGTGPGQAPPPWPGHHPAPTPTAVLPTPVPVIVLDGGRQPVVVTERGELTAVPALLIMGSRQHAIAQWSNPWLIDERWWDSASHVRQADLQLVTDDGTAWLATHQRGQWALTARYD